MGTVGQEGLLSHRPRRRQGGEAIGLLLQAEDPHSSTKQTLQSLPTHTPCSPKSHGPQAGRPTPPSTTLTGEREPPAPAPAALGGRGPAGGGGSSSRGRRQALAVQTRSEIPSRGCPSPRAQRLPAQEEGGDWCRRFHVTDPSLSSCPKMGSSSHEQAAVPHRAADKQKTDSISTK